MALSRKLTTSYPIAAFMFFEVGSTKAGISDTSPFQPQLSRLLELLPDEDLVYGKEQSLDSNSIVCKLELESKYSESSSFYNAIPTIPFSRMVSSVWLQGYDRLVDALTQHEQGSPLSFIKSEFNEYRS
jgi:hypothetical protein